jgi:hypothetical protein
MDDGELRCKLIGTTTYEGIHWYLSRYNHLVSDTS